MKILEVTNLCKTYGKGDTMVKALDNVSFSVEKGEFLAIICLRRKIASAVSSRFEISV